MDQQFAPVSDVTSDDKLWAMLCYIIPIVPIIVLLMEDKKNRPFIKVHAMQSLVFALFYFVVGSIIAAITLGIGSCLLPIAWVVAIYWGVQAYQGKYVTIPVITDFVKKQGWA